MSEDWAPNPFWDFSIVLYRKPGVAEACIALQERLGIDVNLLLYFAWLGSEGRALSQSEAAAVVAHVTAWHDEVVRPLRALRTDLKGNTKGAPPPVAERLRAQIKSAELNAERIEQEMLYALPRAERSAPGKSPARSNIERYLEALKIVTNPADWEAIDKVLTDTNL
jgi:uncharacterized protein (TIGR02444 family)